MQMVVTREERHGDFLAGSTSASPFEQGKKGDST